MSTFPILNHIPYNPKQNSSHITFTTYSTNLPKILTQLSTLKDPTHLYDLTITQDSQYTITITISINENYKLQ